MELLGSGDAVEEKVLARPGPPSREPQLVATDLDVANRHLDLTLAFVGAPLPDWGRMDLEGYVWITTRKLKPGSREEFSRSWQPSEFPEGMLRAYELYSPDGNEVVGVSVWASIESRDRYRLSEVESKRRRAMAPYVLEEVSGFFVGRELKIPRG
jgi:heme-degrading monooxygenase HmoA